MNDWQTYVALAIVAVALVTITITGWRRLRKSPGAGCGGSCGCAKTDLHNQANRPVQ